VGVKRVNHLYGIRRRKSKLYGQCHLKIIEEKIGEPSRSKQNDKVKCKHSRGKIAKQEWRRGSENFFDPKPERKVHT